MNTVINAYDAIIQKSISDFYPRQFSYLQKLITTRALHHAYCFIGPQEGVQNTFVRHCVAQLVCTAPAHTEKPCKTCISCTEYQKGIHPDVFHLDGQEGFGIEEARNIQNHLAHRPTLAQHRIVSVFDAEYMSTNAANALLKILEEPPESAILLMSSTAPARLLPTLRSRLHFLYFSPFSLPSEQSAEAQSQQSSLNTKVVQDTFDWIEGKFERFIQIVTEKTNEAELHAQEIAFWIDFLNADIATRDTTIKKRFITPVKGIQKIQELPKALDQLIWIFRILLLQSVQSSAETLPLMPRYTTILKSLTTPYTKENIFKRLQLLHRLKEMNANNVNKKMIFDYLITTL